MDFARGRFDGQLLKQVSREGACFLLLRCCLPMGWSEHCMDADPPCTPAAWAQMLVQCLEACPRSEFDELLGQLHQGQEAREKYTAQLVELCMPAAPAPAPCPGPGCPHA